MVKPSREKKARGTARVAFIAHLNTITAALEQGYTALAIYQRHQAKLGSAISYPQFARYVRHLREDGVVTPPLGLPAAGPSPTERVKGVPNQPPFPSPKPAPPVTTAAKSSPAAEEPTHARHEPRPRTFVYDGNPRQDDKARLIGTGSRSPKD
jgi:hypothetical protein